MTTNVFEALWGRDDITWHALWRFLDWLCDPDEGHGLGEAFLGALTAFAFGRALAPAKIKREFRFDDAAVAGGKWPDLVIGTPDLAAPSHVLLMDDVDRRRSGDSRKLTNLATYLSHARARFPAAAIRLLVLSNASDGRLLERLRHALGPEVANDSELVGWKLLPLQVTGQWLSTHLADSNIQARPALADYVAWTTTVSGK